ncbi:MAG: translation elongation factor 4 [Erysipelotrichaceae bacterium]|nr:translation elongation factor 4 [Erysipelotrichaceae bacterium]
MDKKFIRNFSIIAHIDHGKSTIADRILEFTHTVSSREMKSQLLDSMDLERERGITIKLNAVRVLYTYHDDEYVFNLIDTPGHVDFSYEVSRSLAACEGALLIVDATQGVEAQTLSNVYLAIDNNLTIIPVINKIDLPSADVNMVKQQIKDKIGLNPDDCVLVSAKMGTNIAAILEQIVMKIPAPKGQDQGPLKALIFDSYYDSYRGVIPLVRIFDGEIRVGDEILLYSNQKKYLVTELGVRTPKEVKVDVLRSGEVGFISAQIKDIKDIRVGDTITLAAMPTTDPFPGYKIMQPMVYSGVYPVDNKKYNDLRDALAKLALNDASLRFEPETSSALGFGFRMGFLGLLHMDVIQERLEREYDINLILTSPSVIYEIELTTGVLIKLDNPSKLPDLTKIKEIREPFVRAEIVLPKEYVGVIMELCQKRRGVYLDLVYLDDYRSELIYELPLSEIIYNFFDQLKSLSKGYATLDYEPLSYRASNLAKMDILLNGEVVDALSTIVYKPTAFNRANAMCLKLKNIIPRQQFEIPIQAAINHKIIARADVKAVRKDVLAKCYGGDITRKKKLLEKQKEGKKRMKAIGSVEVPQEAFMSILSLDDD